eukprot:TRINITY_DN71423_c0_g1_i1.p1 TRINITY_DN71423_c0_g1~~TRINITY_DN71423_c0_g1_i1.p1  ORF type:complete len:166 (-),score=28.79 TRINITY_DN71423_c0_g1_i1:120-617(-)
MFGLGRREGVKRYLVLALAACLVKRTCDEDVIGRLRAGLTGVDVDALVAILLGPRDGPFQWEVGLLYFFMAMLILPEFFNCEWLHQRLPNYIVGFTLCLLFVLFDESVALWDLWSTGRWKKTDTIQHHENLVLSLANLSLFYANLKMHAMRRVLSQVSEERKKAT